MVLKNLFTGQHGETDLENRLMDMGRREERVRCMERVTWKITLPYVKCCCWVTSVVSDSVRPHRRQPTRLPHPWDSPGKNTGVGCHFLFQCMKVKNESEVAQSGPTLSDPMDCSPPGSSVHGVFQARVLEWGAIVELYTSFMRKNKLLSYLWS